ncbi:hypothetical protein LZ32DRAFT_450327 [Colletotrichum eremochloae]|nr:hypothetical protein LZ32DRAFT_450327 [Colletotrichum eremochloae]
MRKSQVYWSRRPQFHTRTLGCIQRPWVLAPPTGTLQRSRSEGFFFQNRIFRVQGRGWLQFAPLAPASIHCPTTHPIPSPSFVPLFSRCLGHAAAAAAAADRPPSSGTLFACFVFHFHISSLSLEPTRISLSSLPVTSHLRRLLASSLPRPQLLVSSVEAICLFR